MTEVNEHPTSSLLRTYSATRRFTEQLCAPLEVEDFVVQTMPDVSPAKWHLAHTTWFFETFVLLADAAGYEAFDPAFGFLFNSYYVTVGERHARPERGFLSRPTVAEIQRYRRHVDAHMERFLDGLDGDAAARLTPVIELGINHEQQHQELLLMDLKHVFGSNPILPIYDPRDAAPRVEVSNAQWHAFSGGRHAIGHAGEGFSFDNETPRHEVWLRPFELASRPVSCGEFLAFIQDGGYEHSELWLSDGWDVLRREAWRAPLYWHQRDGAWLVHGLTGLREVDPAEPVCHVSFYEADAFARWAQARLPTEAEWETAAAGRPVQGNFVESGALHPQARQGSDEVGQLFGDVWEWTSSPYTAYPGFRPLSGNLGEYNGKFMANQMVLRGGCCATSQSHARSTYRNFFYPRQRWQFGGFRLARDS